MSMTLPGCGSLPAGRASVPPPSRSEAPWENRIDNENAGLLVDPLAALAQNFQASLIASHGESA
jgi:hypothetical protein